MAHDPLNDYLATLRAANRPQASELESDLMDAIAEAIEDTQWRDQHRD